MNFPAPNKVNKCFQRRENSAKSLFPVNDHDHADRRMEIKPLDVPDVSCLDIEDRRNIKTADVTKKKTMSDAHDFGKPIAQSSPVQEHRHSNSATMHRSFILQDFIVKGSRSGKKKNSGAQGQMLQLSGSKEHKRINPTRLGTERAKGLYLYAAVMEYVEVQHSRQSPGRS
jgi:hypothetical protein